VVRAMLEDYRAGLTLDRSHEEADRAAGVRLRCPALVLWSQHDDLADLYGDPVQLWASWATDVRGHGIDSGHHMAEEDPAELAGLARHVSLSGRSSILSSASSDPPLADFFGG
jgi:haloacetate dehalogenase